MCYTFSQSRSIARVVYNLTPQQLFKNDNSSVNYPHYPFSQIYFVFLACTKREIEGRQDVRLSRNEVNRL